MQVLAQTQMGQLEVQVTSNRGHTPEELADIAVNRILYIGENVHPAIRDQAVAYKELIRNLLVFYMQKAIESDRTTIANTLKNAGHPELAKIIGA